MLVGVDMLNVLMPNVILLSVVAPANSITTILKRFVCVIIDHFFLGENHHHRSRKWWGPEVLRPQEV